MKKILLSLVIFLLLSVRPTFAADASVSAKAQDLLDRVATKVAELSQKLQKSYWGKVKNLGTSSLVIVTDTGEKAIITSDATSFFRFRSSTKSEINFAGLKIGDDIAAIGTIDPATSDLTARQVIAKIKRQNVVGKIDSLDKQIATVNGKKLDLTDIPLKSASLSGKLSPAKIADVKESTTLFAIAYSPDEKTGIFSVLTAVIYNP